MTSPSPGVLDWLARLIALDTTSRDSNLPLVDLVAEHARSLGLDPHVFPNEDGTKANLVVTVPDADGKTAGGVMLSGHSDVVPVDGQAWASNPFTLTERDGLLYGRGTADMKGFNAIIVDALAELVAQPLREPVHIALSHDEEVGCIGAQPLVDGMRSVGLAPRVCFVGEPTSMRMIRGHKSINLVTITLHGLAAHSSLTAQGVNAIEHAASVVRYWRERADAWRTTGPFDEAYPIAHTTGSVNQIAGGNGVNIIPAECSVTLEFRSIGTAADDQAEIDALVAYCREIERAMRAEDASASVEIDVRAQTPGLDTPTDSDAVRLGEQLGLEVQDDKVTYGTEAGIYANAGISTVVVGPGDIAQAHKPDEFIDPDQLAQCQAFIGRLIDHVRV
ncbi:acetylornithine deacetylase [Propioniciclava sinopodophylli]|uniref:Acetylornithine deacetylase n=1 Tax=Propioniciclava sinopodophylli TaxID=1837344 RepID=A0A4Q9KHW6_9ACTN|nr:acetylornithine deacetylase [Propioniciclava sinopodophylli]TBT87305.1 acetylornithine deacetylase [Propioniciclava sinopodophylli]